RHGGGGVAGGTGIIRTYAGKGTTRGGNFSGPATSASIPDPVGLAVNAGGDLFIADESNLRVRKVRSTNGMISTYAGGGAPFGEGGDATSAYLQPTGLATDPAGNLFIADADSQLVR